MSGELELPSSVVTFKRENNNTIIAWILETERKLLKHPDTVTDMINVRFTEIVAGGR